MEKNRLKEIKEIIIAILLAIVFIFSQIFAYYQGVIFGADNHEIVEEVKDDVFNKKESFRRYSSAGTTVPSSGYIDNIYFNTNLNSDEVLNIINKLNYIDVSNLGFVGYEAVFIYSDSSMNYALGAVRSGEDYYISLITDGSNVSDFWSYGFGWRAALVNPLPVNNDNALSDLAPMVGQEIQNEVLKNLFSITPFVEDEKPLFFEQFIEDASDIVLGFITILVNATVSLTDVMYDESTNQLTIVGSAFALALAVGVVYLFFRLIRGLIRSNNRG